MSLFELLSICAYYGQLVVIGVGLWQMHRASTLRNKQLDDQHTESMTAMQTQHAENHDRPECPARRKHDRPQGTHRAHRPASLTPIPFSCPPWECGHLARCFLRAGSPPSPEGVDYAIVPVSCPKRLRLTPIGSSSI